MAFFSRIKKIGILFMILLLILMGRLVYLQGFTGKELAALGLMGRIHELKSSQLRGTIFDRNMQPLTGRQEVLSVLYFPAQCDNKELAFNYLLPFSKISSNALHEQIFSAKRPLRVIENITQQEGEMIKSAAPAGVVVSNEELRYGLLASHLIGYVSFDDNHGVSGLEATYDDLLSDSGGKYLAALADARAQLIPGLQYRTIKLSGSKEAKSLQLTIDLVMQKKAEDVFDRYAKKGAVVILNPYTGEVLSMVSRPNFDADHLNDYLTQANSPLLNRAISAYQPGSVFKLAIAAAALEAGIVTPEQKFYDRGYIDVDGTIFRGWDYKKGAREINFTQAVANSSNPVFIQVGLQMGMERLLPFLRKLGFGEVSSLQLFGEAAGNLPNAANSYIGETANLSIGQGECETTPVQIASLVGAIVNNGMKVEPILLKRVISDDDNSATEINTKGHSKVVFSSDTARKLRTMMEEVTKTGTGQAAFVPQGGSAGKTGSAETGRIDAEGKSISHAWFAGFAPLDHPKYVAVVFVEEGMSGGDVAAPIFKELIEAIEQE